MPTEGILAALRNMIISVLTASDRIRLITDISKALGGENWPLIDLTLDQFGRPTRDDWGADKASYVLWSIKGADDETLLSLGRHLGQDAGRPAADPEFWTPGFFRLFLSHLSSHKKEAEELQVALADYGISAFVAHSDIEPGSEWVKQIELALSTCDALAAMLTHDFHASKWTDQEIGFAMGRGVLIVSIRLGEDPYGFIGRFQGIAGEGRSAGEIAADLSKVLLNQKQTSGRMKEALVAGFEAADTYKKAIARSKVLEQVKDFPDTLRKRIRNAVATNNQLSGAFGVPERIARVFDPSGDQVQEQPAPQPSSFSDDVPF